MKPLFDLATYATRREAFTCDLEDAVVVLAAAPERVRSNDVLHPYRPSNDMLYLSGFTEPNSVAVLRPGDGERSFVLFVQPRDPKREKWEGKTTGVEGAREVFGADEAYPIDELPEVLPGLLGGRRDLYYALNVRPEIDRKIFAAMDSLRGGRGKPNRAPLAIVDPLRRLHDLRRVKDRHELDLMRRAAEITAAVHVELMTSVRPGQMEYEVAALIDYEFRSRGAIGPGYDTIVGGGVNATILHYTVNDAPLREGTLVLIDAGAEYRYYNADITRTFPVGTRFTPAQRDLYQAVLEVQQEAIAKIAPGESAHDLSEWSKRRLTRAMVDLGLLDGELDTLIEDKAYERFYMHGLGHYLGMDVHDVGTYLVGDDKPLPLVPGVVMTVEPGLYIPEDADDLPKEMRGIGIRIEDDVIVTDDGGDVITKAVPKAIDEIEALRAEAS